MDLFPIALPLLSFS
jgi:hypothetical protein